jgi:Protein of unknown function (DUF2934)
MTTVVELKVLEYWRRRPELRKGWERDASLEVAVCSMDDDPRYQAYNNNRMRNPAYPLSIGTITEEPGGAQFEELVADLLTRYPATPREAAEAALRSVWEKHALSWRWEFQMVDVDEQAIRARAYRLWEAAGKPEGQEEHFWHEAERQLKKEQIDHELKTPDNL